MSNTVLDDEDQGTSPFDDEESGGGFFDEEESGGGANADLERMLEKVEELNVDSLDGIDENQEYPVLPRGTYNAVVEQATFGSSRAGNPMVTWRLRATHEGQGYTLFYHTTVNQRGLARLKRTFVRLDQGRGYVEKPLKEILRRVGEYYTGTRCKAKVDINVPTKEYPNKSNTVKEILAAGEGGFIDDDE